MKELPLSDGRVALVDDDVFDEIAHLTWFVNQNTFVTHKYREGRSKHLILRRYVTKANDGDVVRHKDGNILNCQRSNLVVLTKAAFTAQVQPMRVTKYRGVRPSNGRFAALAVFKRRDHFIGVYDTIEEAARVADAATYIAYGDALGFNLGPPDQELVTMVRLILAGHRERTFSGAKINEEQVYDIRARALSGESISSIALDVGIDESNVRRALSGHQWKQVGRPIEPDILRILSLWRRTMALRAPTTTARPRSDSETPSSARGE